MFEGAEAGAVPPRSFVCESGSGERSIFDEREEIRIDHVGVRCGHAVREAGVGFEVPCFSSLTDRAPVVGNGQIWSSSPCITRTGISTIAKSS